MPKKHAVSFMINKMKMVITDKNGESLLSCNSIAPCVLFLTYYMDKSDTMAMIVIVKMCYKVAFFSTKNSYSTPHTCIEKKTGSVCIFPPDRNPLAVLSAAVKVK